MSGIKLYTKMSVDIVYSSLWALDAETIKVWWTIVSLADLDGVINKSVGTIAHMARIPLEKTKEAIRIFEAPDADSTTPDREGRRLIPLESGGWQIVTNDKYRELGWSEEKKKFERERKARYRENKKGKTSNPPAEPGQNAGKKNSAVTKPKPTEPSEFQRFWEVYPKKVERLHALKTFVQLGLADHIETVLAMVAERKKSDWNGREAKYIPNPGSFLNAEDFTKPVEPSTPKPAPVIHAPVKRVVPPTIDCGGVICDVRRAPKKEDYRTESAYLSFSAMYRNWHREFLIANPEVAKQIEAEETDRALGGAK